MKVTCHHRGPSPKATWQYLTCEIRAFLLIKRRGDYLKKDIEKEIEKEKRTQKTRRPPTSFLEKD